MWGKRGKGRGERERERERKREIFKNLSEVSDLGTHKNRTNVERN